MHRALGEYAGVMPVSLITRVRAKSSAANPEIIANIKKDLSFLRAKSGR